MNTKNLKHRPLVIDESREPHFDAEGNFTGYGKPSKELVMIALQNVQEWLLKISVEDPELYEKVMSKSEKSQ